MSTQVLQYGRAFEVPAHWPYHSHSILRGGSLVEHRLAGRSRRLINYAMDAAIVYGINLGLVLAWFRLGGAPLPNWVYYVAALAVAFIYYFVSESLSGRTLAKWMTGSSS